ncbi:MAG: PPK2 family polyphosphate kinase [Ginsengibacter sp.]
MSDIHLKEISTRAPSDLDKKDIKEETVKILEELNQLQNLLFAEGNHAILVVIQGMDASGKDGVIRNVFTSMNPQGVSVTGFKAPTEEELKHDFLWRIHKNAPAKGMIKIFNRSQYEDILITRVHQWCDDETAHKRMKAINDWENLLVENNNTTILKFYLHISPQEQKERLDERMQDPTKMWKYNAKDYEESLKWDTYMKMYEDCFANCNIVPWTIVPSDQNWYKEYIIASQLKKAMEDLKLEYPGLKK